MKPFPVIVIVAGLIWLAVGTLGMIGTILSMGANGANQQPPGAACGNCGGGLFAFAFFYCGYQTVKGIATDTRGNSAGSILFGMFQMLAAGFLAFGGFGNGPQRAPGGEAMLFVAAIVGFMGGSLILAGLLGLAGRADYLEWREIHHPKPRKRSRREDRDDR